MSFAILHGVHFYVYLTLGDANIENTKLTQHTQKGNHLTLVQREENSLKSLKKGTRT